MQISRFDLKHIGTYSDFIWNTSISYIENGDQKSYELGKLNLFYGENGSGKSTLSKFFRLLNGEINIRNDLVPWGSNMSIDYTIYDDIGGNFTNKIKIFDKKYIKDQVGDFIFDSDESTEQNKSRGEHFLLIGAFVERERNVQKHEKELGEKEKENNESIAKIEQKEIENKTYYGANYIEIYNNVITGSINQEVLNKNLETLNKDLSLQETIKNKTQKIENISDTFKKLTKIEIIDEVYWDSFGKTIDNAISFMFGEKDSIIKLINITHEHALEKCLFCNKSIKDNGYYSERIQLLLSQLITPCVDTISSSLVYLTKTLDNISNITVSENNTLSENKVNYDKYRDIKIDDSKPYPNRTYSLKENDCNLIQQCKLLIIDKQNKLSESIAIGEIGNDINSLIKDINNAIHIYNNQLDGIEEDISLIKQRTISQSDIDNTNSHIEEIKKALLIIKDQEKITDFIKELKKVKEIQSILDTEKEVLNAEKTKIKNDFSSFTSEYGIILQKLIEQINPGLARKINFSLQGTYTHGRGRCGFEIKHAESTTIITKYLSDGEKRSIAFSYFLSQFLELDKDGNLNPLQDYGKNLIVVFDDPSTDYDKNNKSRIAERIVYISKGFEQTFIFTHDEKFRDYIIKETDINSIGGEVKRYKITKNYVGKSFISIANKNQLESNRNILLSSLTEQNPDLSLTAHALRYCIEHLVCNELLGESESSIDALVKNKLGGQGFIRLTKANDKNSAIRSLYTFCNNNGSHYGEADGFEPLAENIRNYFVIYDHIFQTTFTRQIPQI